MSVQRAIFFTGGGARGAYQAGVLKAIAEIHPVDHVPVDILSGVSSGSINAAFIGAYSDFQEGVRKLLRVWSQINCGQVFEIDNLSLIGSVLRTIVEIIIRNIPEKGHYLLDTSPLRKLIEGNIDFSSINQNIDHEIFKALIVTALNYETSETISFFNTKKEIKTRKKFRYTTYKSELTSDHIMASTAIPLFFPSVKINNESYGDGAFRNSHPLRTAIAMGADRILIIGVKHDYSNQPILENSKEGISFGKILSMAFNSIFEDNIDIDLETLQYINNNISPLEIHEKQKIPFRHIDYMYIRPTEDIGQIALSKVHLLPRLLRYLLGRLGSSAQSSDLISYLLCEAEYCHELINMGYRDTMNRKNEVIQFFSN